MSLVPPSVARGVDANLEARVSPESLEAYAPDALGVNARTVQALSSKARMPLPAAQITPETPHWEGAHRDVARWKLSLAPFAVSQALDVSSSRGMRELNPVLASPNGQFGARGAAVKLGTAGAFAGMQILIVKKYPRSAKFFEKINWASAGVTAGFAAHNYAIR